MSPLNADAPHVVLSQTQHASEKRNGNLTCILAHGVLSQFNSDSGPSALFMCNMIHLMPKLIFWK